MKMSRNDHNGPQRGTALVTGASGFIGRNLVDALLTQGYEVRTLGRTKIEAAKVASTQADITDTEAVARVLDGVDVVFHLAGVGSPSSPLSLIDEMYRVNVVGTHSILQASVDACVRRVIVASSAAVYGAIDSAAIPEDSELKPVNPYGLTKVAQEQVCEMYARLHDLDTVALRLFNVYGPGEDMSENNRKLIPTLLRRVSNREPIRIYGDGLQTRDFIHVNDVVAAFVQLSKFGNHSHRNINIGTGVGTSILEVVRVVAELIGEDALIDQMASRPGEVSQSVASVRRAMSADVNARTTFIDGLQDLIRARSFGAGKCVH